MIILLWFDLDRGMGHSLLYWCWRIVLEHGGKLVSL